ncbi:MAG TPA: glycosyltransferase family 2 protein [Ignavibacteria bacterium]|nr:glycosyltransferase family 2 protein [Ignavibacteria bacterium]
MLVSFIIVNYNTGGILKDCIESVYKYEKEIMYEIIIVDNSSSDDSKKIIENIASAGKNIKAIFLNERISFSAANNKGYEISSGEYILIMNPDIIFTEPVLKKLTDDLRDNKSLGAVSPLLTGSDGKFQRAYFQRYPSLMQFILFYSILGNVFQKNKKLVYKYQENGDIDTGSEKIEDTDQIPCAFFMTGKGIFEKAGKMDPAYFLFFEDVDLSFQINKMYKLGVDTTLSVTHLGGSSFKISDDYWLYGRFIIGMMTFFKKNYSQWKTFTLKIISVINSNMIVLTEEIKKIFGKEDDYRLRKHQYFLNELKKTNL